MAHSLDHESYKKQVSSVWLATVWLSVITIVEVIAALAWLYWIDPEGTKSKFLLNGFFILASLLKAFFIVGEFMHVRYERRALGLTILVPLLFLVWFIVAFLWEGSEWNNNRERWNAQPVIPVYSGSHGHDHDHKDGTHGHEHDHKKDAHGHDHKDVKKGGH